MAIVKGYKGSWEPASHPLMLIDLETNEYLGLQGLPKELDYNPEPAWATIKVPGRNAPWYNYTGSEDTLTLELTWYARQENRQDVIAKCRWIESLSKSNSYDDPPHRCKFKWGDLFLDEIWIVTQANYKLGVFDSANGYLPGLATQQVVLKKWLDYNSTQERIIGDFLPPLTDGTKIELPPNNLYSDGFIVDYGDGDYTLEPGTERYPESLQDETYYIKDGDNLSDLAVSLYGDSKLWHILAKANDIDNPLDMLTSGLILRIPKIPGIVLRKGIL